MIFARWLSLAIVVTACALGSCATTSSNCEQQVSACLKRCENSTDDRGPALSSLPPQITETECEKRCGCPKATTTPKPPQGPPTPTGNAQP
jgi:hypothetical protein